VAGDPHLLQLGITNAAPEGTNRLIKEVKRHACGLRNEQHFRDRVRLNCTRYRNPDVSENRPPARSKLESPH
jgi:hypothetical protein